MLIMVDLVFYLSELQKVQVELVSYHCTLQNSICIFFFDAIECFYVFFFFNKLYIKMSIRYLEIFQWLIEGASGLRDFFEKF